MSRFLIIATFTIIIAILNNQNSKLSLAHNGARLSTVH